MEELQNVYIPREHIPAKIITVIPQLDDEIEPEDKLLIYEYDEPVYTTNDTLDHTKREIKAYKKTRDYIFSKYSGIVKQILVEENENIKSCKKPIIVIKEYCGHSVQLNEMCALCGKDLSISDYLDIDKDRATINMMHDVVGLTVSRQEAARIEKQNTQRLLDSKKLSLIVDLDQTILHATCNNQVDTFFNENKESELIKDIVSFELDDTPDRYHIKLRPGTREFLENANKLYELHIYTMGTRQYADKIALAIDPDKKYFSERILSRDESGSITRKKIERLFPCDTSMVVVIDDRADVWDWSPNLIKVFPYEFFYGVGDINNHETNNPTEINNGFNSNELKNLIINENDQELNRVSKVLTQIHEQFYEKHEQKSDVRKILPKIKEKILSGVHITFSSIFPVGSDIQNSEIWQWAESFGAICYLELNRYITHLICKPIKTQKVKQAIKDDIKMVSVEWLFDSLIKWEKLDENNYAIRFEKDTNNIKSPFLETENSQNEKETASQEDQIELKPFDINEADREVDEFLAESDNTETDTEDDKPRNPSSNNTPALVKQAAFNRYSKNFGTSLDPIPDSRQDSENEEEFETKTPLSSENEESFSDLIREIEDT